jgi:hypothetical protein
MAILNTTVRCNLCGVRLPEEDIAECPSCHRHLAQADKWSERTAWARTRKAGRTRYIFLRWVIGWGGLFSLAMSLGFLLKGARWPVFVYTWSIGLLAGYLMGVFYWRAAEREYAGAEQKSRTMR